MTIKTRKEKQRKRQRAGSQHNRSSEKMRAKAGKRLQQERLGHPFPGAVRTDFSNCVKLLRTIKYDQTQHLSTWAGKMPQRLSVLVTLAEGLGLVPSTPVVTNTQL